MDERYECIRAIRTKKLKYIKNFTCDKPYYQYMQSAEKSPIMKEIRENIKSNTLAAEAALYTRAKKPAEELYDVEKDPYEINNLALLPEYKLQLVELQKQLFTWMKNTNDLGLIPEPEMIRLEKNYGNRYRISKNWKGDYFSDLLKTAACAGNPKTADFDILTDALDNEDISIRTWGLVGLGNYPAPAQIDHRRIKAFLKDPSPVVRLATAALLCRLERYKEAIPILRKEIKSPQEWIRLQAAIIIDENISIANELVPELEESLSDTENKYLVRVANHTLNRVRNTNNLVR
jgi:uncharacterized sulfatase